MVLKSDYRRYWGDTSCTWMEQWILITDEGKGKTAHCNSLAYKK